MYPETLPLSLKVATLAPIKLSFSSILIPLSFSVRKRFSFLFYPFEFHLIAQNHSFLFLLHFSYSLFPFFTHINNSKFTHPLPLSKSRKGYSRTLFLFLDTAD